MSILIVFTIALYIAVTVLFWMRVNHGVSEESEDLSDSGASFSLGKKSVLMSLVVVIVVCHGTVLYASAIQDNAINLALGNDFSLVSLMTLAVYAFATFKRQTLNLGIFALPLGLAGLTTGLFLTGDPLIVEITLTVLWVHLVIAVLAFGILCIAAAQALLLYVQENQLHSHHPGTFFPALPAIQTMETNLFQLTLLGVILLTTNLVTGMISSWQVYGKSLEFNHHILLSFIAWLGFSALLAGHKIYGWRGRIAAKWTLVAFAVLILAYFGTRFVTSIILA
ncbi:MAG: cytochrome c biogenesis protein CcsA [Arenicellales bacterium]